MRIATLVPAAVITALVAWSGLLLAEGTGGVAEDIGASTPGPHAPRRRPRKKKKPRKKTKGPADAGAPVVAPATIDASATPCLNVAPDAAPSDRATAPSRAPDDDEDDDDDQESRDAATAADAGAPRLPRKHRGDGGVEAGADAGSEDDDDDDEEDENDDEDTAYELGVEVATDSRLVWRGLAESRGAVLQTSGWAGVYGLSLEGWASYLLNAEGPFSTMSVVGADVTASYVLTLGDLRVGPGFTLLYFPEALSSSVTAEASLGASYRLGDFHIVSGTSFDVVNEPGAYFGTLGVSWGRAKGPWTVKTIADLGWATGRYNFEYLGRDVDAFDVIHAGASVRHDLGSVVYVELHLDASRLLAPTLSGSVEEPMLVVGGAAIGLDWSTDR